MLEVKLNINAYDNASSVIDKVRASLKQAGIDADVAFNNVGNSAKGSSKNISEFDRWMKENRQEQHKFRAVVNESKDAIAVFGLTLNAMAGSIGSNSESTKQLVNSVNTGIVAYQGFNAILGTASKFLPALGGPWGTAIATVGSLAFSLFSLKNDGEKVTAMFITQKEHVDAISKAYEDWKNKLHGSNEANNAVSKSQADSLLKRRNDFAAFYEDLTKGTVKTYDYLGKVYSERVKGDNEEDARWEQSKKTHYEAATLYQNNYDKALAEGKKEDEARKIATQELNKAVNDLGMQYQAAWGSMYESTTIAGNGISAIQKDILRVSLDVEKQRELVSTTNAIKKIEIETKYQKKVLQLEEDIAIESEKDQSKRTEIHRKYALQRQLIEESGKFKKEEVGLEKQIQEIAFKADISGIDGQINFLKNKISSILIQSAKQSSQESLQLQIDGINQQTNYQKIALGIQEKAELDKLKAISKSNEDYQEKALQITQQYSKKTELLEMQSEEQIAQAKINLHRQVESIRSQISLEIIPAGKERELAIVNEWERKSIDQTNADAVMGAKEKEKLLENITKVGAQRRAQIEIAENKKTYQAISGTVKTILGTMNQMSANKHEAEITRLETEKESRLSAIDAELSAEGLSEERKKELLLEREQIEKDYSNRIKTEKLKAWESDKSAKKTMALIDTAAAVVEALPNPWLAAAALVAGMAQVAIIESTPAPKFHQGGIVPGIEGEEVDIVAQAGEVIRTPQQENRLQRQLNETIEPSNSNNNPVYITVNNHFNSPIPHGEWIKESIQEGMRKTGLTVDKYFVNNRKLIKL